MVMENGNLAMDIPLGGSSYPLFPGPFGILVFGEGGKLEDLEQGTRMNQQQTQPTCYASSKNGTWARAVEYEPSHHCAIPTTL